MASSTRSPMAERLAERLHALRLHRGWNMDRVAAAARLSRTTVFHLERGAISRPRASTLHKLARAFEVPVESLAAGSHVPTALHAVQPVSREPARRSEPEGERGCWPDHDEAARRAFDRATNPVVQALAESEPGLFTGWVDEDWDELYSSFGTGGSLSEEGVRLMAARIARNRETCALLRIVLQTHLADAAAAMVEVLYRQIVVDPGHTAPPDGAASAPAASGDP